ncbi:hypothetical protein K1T71_013774 [Dendrolimus kikuchii]|uniref:Uncharacterized protein n=1 Tax=Dendrolimus kikuchii TaxID=765133 RepID=A0ACC1CFP3_9NEOP|nr:hypothetical protein K1T71_013774 [Dendrolimus kikuchii]
MYFLILCCSAVIYSATSSPILPGVLDEGPASNLDLLIPIIIKSEKPLGKKSLYLDDEVRKPVDINLQDTVFSNIPASAFVLDSKRSHFSTRDGTLTTNDKNESKQASQLKLKLENNLIKKTQQLERSKHDLNIKFLLLKKCLNNIDEKYGNKFKTSASLEVILYLCKELVDSFMDSEEAAKIGFEHRAKFDKESRVVLADDKKNVPEKVEASEEEANKGKHIDEDCTNCCQVLVYGEVDDDGEDIKKTIKDHLNVAHSALEGLPGVAKQTPVSWFGPVNGRRDWMLLNDKDKSMLKMYIHLSEK